MRYLKENIEIHNELNPKLWDKSNKLRRDVRDKMLEIVDYFKEYIGEIPLNIVDIQFVGSNASYNYTAHSDIDLHIITNFELVDCSKELLELLYNNVKASFNSTYNITIKNLECELYIEDVKTGVTSNGIYSVLNDEWIKFPQKLTSVPNVDVSSELDKWTTRIEKTLKSSDMEAVNKDINDLYLIRRNSIAIDGEYGSGNQLFKEVRNLGLLDALKDRVVELQSKNLSLESYTVYYDYTLDESFSIAHCPRYFETVQARTQDDAESIVSRRHRNCEIFGVSIGK